MDSDALSALPILFIGVALAYYLWTNYNDGR